MVEYESKDRGEKAAEKRLLDTLAELGGKQVSEDDVVFEGRKVVLPQTMTERSAIKFLQKRIEQKEEVTSFVRIFKYRPWDGAYALQSALKKNFGTTGIAQATASFFGKNPPKLITIDTSVDKQEQVPWGSIEFPPLEAMLSLGSTRDPELGILFTLNVECARKYAAQVEGLFKLIEAELKVNSIYKGKALTGAEHPTFIDPYLVNRKKVVYAEDVQRQLSANIWSLMRHTQAQRDAGLPLKRSVLLSGPYGTGKSLAAMLTAQEAVENGWTFIQCRPGKDDLGMVMQTAVLYQPSVVFYEDVDTIAQSGDPDKVSTLLDMFDGISAKGTELVCVMTTNHAELIHKGMVRPGRLDAVIKIEALDAAGKESLIKASVPPALLGTDIDFAQIDTAMEGFLPAFIKEAIDRAVRYAIARTYGHPDVLTTEDFVDAATGLRPQLDLMHGASEGTSPDSLEAAFRNVVGNASLDSLKGAFIERDGDEWAQIKVSTD